MFLTQRPGYDSELIIYIYNEQQHYEQSFKKRKDTANNISRFTSKFSINNSVFSRESMKSSERSSVVHASTFLAINKVVTLTN